MGIIEDATQWCRRQGAPFTLFLVASLLVVPFALSGAGYHGADRVALMVGGKLYPWTLFTYPWVSLAFRSGMGLLGLAFILFWLYQAGTSLEREMGSARLAGLWFASTGIGGLCFWGAALASGVNIALYQPYIPIAALTIAWCFRNSSASISLFGVLPLNSTALAVVTLIAVFVGYGIPLSLLGIGACVPLLISFLFATDRIPGLPFASGSPRRTGRRKPSPKEKEYTTRGQVSYDQSYFDDVKRREQERAERERLKKLLGDDDEQVH